MRIAIVDDLETERAQLKRALRGSCACAAPRRSYWNLKAARAFSPQKKSSALPLRTAPSPPRSCSADKRIFRAYPDNARCDKPQWAGRLSPAFTKGKE